MRWSFGSSGDANGTAEASVRFCIGAGTGAVFPGGTNFVPFTAGFAPPAAPTGRGRVEFWVRAVGLGFGFACDAVAPTAAAASTRPYPD